MSAPSTIFCPYEISAKISKPKSNSNTIQKLYSARKNASAPELIAACTSFKSSIWCDVVIAVEAYKDALSSLLGLNWHSFTLKLLSWYVKDHIDEKRPFMNLLCLCDEVKLHRSPAESYDRAWNNKSARIYRWHIWSATERRHLRIFSEIIYICNVNWCIR